MSKPSIFSRDYKTKMKKRKRRIAFIIFFLIFLCSNFYLYSKLNKSFNLFNLKNHLTSIFNKKEVNNDKKEVTKEAEEIIKDNEEVKPEITKEQTPEAEIKEEKSYSFELSGGKKFKAIYEDSNGEKKFVNVTGDSESLDFNISPDGKGIVIYDTLVQGIILMNLDGVTKDISKKVYIASNGSKYTREETIKDKSGYVWAINPKFIDNENIAYVSQLPWFKQIATKYVWIVNINNSDYPTKFENINGENIILGKLENKGLIILIDGKAGFLKANGDLISN
ncbi:MAG: hypothetical protein H7Y18_21200 [Clostridiaceae bacterium]|nr:hypothetical protein [Clostridiaceae bacterium]